MHKEYILLNGFRKAKKGFTAGFHVPLTKKTIPTVPGKSVNDYGRFLCMPDVFS